MASMVGQKRPIDAMEIDFTEGQPTKYSKSEASPTTDAWQWIKDKNLDSILEKIWKPGYEISFKPWSGELPTAETVFDFDCFKNVVQNSPSVELPVWDDKARSVVGLLVKGEMQESGRKEHLYTLLGKTLSVKIPEDLEAPQLESYLKSRTFEHCLSSVCTIWELWGMHRKRYGKNEPWDWKEKYIQDRFNNPLAKFLANSRFIFDYLRCPNFQGFSYGDKISIYVSDENGKVPKTFTTPGIYPGIEFEVKKALQHHWH